MAAEHLHLASAVGISIDQANHEAIQLGFRAVAVCRREPAGFWGRSRETLRHGAGYAVHRDAVFFLHNSNKADWVLQDAR
jgi:hypothetical protein